MLARDDGVRAGAVKKLAPPEIPTGRSFLMIGPHSIEIKSD